jgi:DedD protein
MLIFRANILRKTVMAPPPIIEERNQDGHRAKVRIGVAVALLVTAIGILTVLNQRRTEQVVEETQAEQPVEQVSLSSEDMEAPAVIPEDAIPSITPSQPEEATATEPPPPPVPGQLPDALAAPSGKSTAGPVLEEESSGASPAMPYIASATKTLGKPGMSVAAVRSPAPHQASVAQASGNPMPTPTAPAPKAFEVQLGVFTDIDNAKQLQAKLAQHGIPSHTETRVQIGPFKSRVEADRAREKLKSLGITAVILGK